MGGGGDSDDGRGGDDDDEGVVAIMIFVDVQYHYNLLNYSSLKDRLFGSIRNMGSAYQIKENTWHHIAVTYDYENSKQAIYRDGRVRHYFFHFASLENRLIMLALLIRTKLV